MEKHLELVAQGIKSCGGAYTVADDLNLKQPSVHAWEKNGLPKSEATGDTSYAKYLEEKSKGKVKQSRLLLTKFPNIRHVATALARG